MIATMTAIETTTMTAITTAIGKLLFMREEALSDGRAFSLSVSAARVFHRNSSRRQKETLVADWWFQFDKSAP
jgi:hypothetical protein